MCEIQTTTYYKFQILSNCSVSRQLGLNTNTYSEWPKFQFISNNFISSKTSLSIEIFNLKVQILKTTKVRTDISLNLDTKLVCFRFF